MLIRLAKELDWVPYTVLMPEPEEKLKYPNNQYCLVKIRKLIARLKNVGNTWP